MVVFFLYKPPGAYIRRVALTEAFYVTSLVKLAHGGGGGAYFRNFFYSNSKWQSRYKSITRLNHWKVLLASPFSPIITITTPQVIR